MSKSKKRPQQPKTPSAVAVQAFDRPGGIHKDQRRRSCPKQLRRDKSYRSEW